MSHAVPNILLTIQITEAQLGYLAYLYPDEDPEEALVKLLEGDRLRALRRAERKVEVLHLDDEGDRTAPALTPEGESSLPAESENPVGALQEYCQTKALPIPTYDFEDVAEGFCCTVRASGLMASAIPAPRRRRRLKWQLCFWGLWVG